MVSPRFWIRNLRAVVAVVALACVAAAQAKEVVAPPAGMVHQGVPAIPASLVRDLYNYVDYDSSTFLGWSESAPEPIISRFKDNSLQVARVAAPLSSPAFFAHLPPDAGELFYPPHGRYIVYSKAVGNNFAIQLYRYDIDSRSSTLLTDGASKNLYPVWSRSGGEMAYSSTRRNGRDMDIYLMDPVHPETDRLLCRCEGEDWAVFDWSPHDKRLILSQYLSPYETYLWVLDIETGRKFRVVPPGQHRAFNGASAQFSKDGAGLFFSTDLGSDFRRLAYVDLRSQKCRVLTRKTHCDIDEFALSPDGGYLAFIANEDGVGKIHLMDTTSYEELRFPTLPIGVASRLKWHPREPDLGFSFSSYSAPANAYSINVKTGQLVRWTASLLQVKREGTREPELIRWKSFDGRTISGFLYLPSAPSLSKYPVVVDIHGGVYDEFRPEYNGGEDHYLTAAMGIAVIHPNVRGSSGFGKSFMRLSRGRLREGEVRDLGALVEWIRQRPDLDPNRVLVEGASYGGYLALSVAESYPTEISGVLAQSAVTDLVTFVERSGANEPDAWRREFGDERDPDTRRFLERLAPVNNAGKIARPSFLAVGGSDMMTSVTEIESIVSSARKNGVPVWYLMAKAEMHGFADPSNYTYWAGAKLLFIRTYLTPSAPGGSAAKTAREPEEGRCAAINRCG